MRSGLELGTVQVPLDSSRDAQEALAVRRDLLPIDTYARSEDRMEAGAVPGGLAGLASLLKDTAGLLTHATNWLDRSSPDGDSLRVEASRVEQSAARISQLATMIKEEDCG
ncbi:hypothetical protein [Streptomyces goshikiensis]|uniref:hypothetical protein n=1 Tax=Streptomyces goshikiensis TaxID=1942 RepID=UPI0036AA4076